MFKIVFVYPDFENLGLEYLMATCLKAGYDVDFVGYHAGNPFFGKKNRKVRFEPVAKSIARKQPRIAAFSCVTDNYQFQLSCARALKKILPEVIVVFGGIHPTAVPERVLRNDEVDAVAIGEAEISLINFLQQGGQNDTFVLPDEPVDGIVFKRAGRLVGEIREGPIVEDLNTLPFPAKHLVLKQLKDQPLGYFIMTSRGCPYNCSFCFNSFFLKTRGKKAIRQRSVENVIEELVWAKSQFGIKHVAFWDDSFTFSKKWIREFSARYRDEIALPFYCCAIPRYINTDVAEALAQAGCTYVQLGVQSLSQEICRDVLKRKWDYEKVAEAVQLLKRVGIMVQVDHMLGLPGDTVSIEKESVLFYNRVRPDVISVFWLVYYPKTAITDSAVQQKRIDENMLDRLEEGLPLSGDSYGTIHVPCDCIVNAKPYYAISFLLNYLPFMPRWLVSILIRRDFYRILRIENFFISHALPRAVHSVVHRKYFHRRLLTGFFKRMLGIQIG